MGIARSVLWGGRPGNRVAITGFRLLHNVQTGPGYTQPAVRWVSEVLFFPDVKLTPQSSAEVGMPSSAEVGMPSSVGA